MRILLFIFLFSSLQTLAAEIKEVGLMARHLIVTQEKENPFKVNDYVCVVQKNLEIACGFIQKTSDTTATVDLEFRVTDVYEGDKVARSYKSLPCDPNPPYVPPTAKMKKGQSSPPFLRTCTDEEKKAVGKFRIPAKYFFGLGFNLLSPFTSLEYKAFEKLSIGGSLNFLTLPSSIPAKGMDVDGTLYGAHVFATYYPSDFFSRFNFRLGLGYVRGRIQLRETLADWNGFSWIAAGGFRFVDWQNFSFGISAGFHYFKLNSTGSTPAHFFSPIAQLEFGLGF